MSELPHSTKNYLEEYKEILLSLSRDIQSVLGENLVGVYITGSLVNGTWNPKTSDIDTCIILKNSLSDSEVVSLGERHQEFLVRDGIGEKLEGEYVTLRSLKEKDFSEMVGSLKEGNFSLEHNNLSQDNLAGLNQNSIALIGPEFISLGVTVTEQELKAAVRSMLQEDREEAKTEQDFNKKLYLLINSLRCIYTLRTGKLPTKQGSVEAGKNLLTPSLYDQLQAYFCGNLEEFNIPNELVVSIIDSGLELS